MNNLYTYFEGAEEKSKLKKLEQILKGLKYEDYVEKLNELVKDPKTAALVEGAFGGDLANVKLKMTSCNIPTTKLVPTQNEIDLDKSLKRGLKDISSIELYFKNPAMLFIPIVTYNKQFIIDGHHRWSQFYCFNPNAKLRCINFEGDLSPIEMLKSVQGSIAADIHNVPVSTVDGKSIFDEDKKSIQKYIYENICDDVVNILLEKYNVSNKDEVVDTLVENVIKLKTDNEPINSAPKRDVMPQTDKAPDALNRVKLTTRIK